MIIAVVVSIFSAQGVLAQDEMALLDASDYESSEYDYEEQEYTDINIFELPFSIRKSVSEDYTNYRILKGYMSKDNTYKVILKNKQNNTKVVFASAKGKWIMPNNIKS